MCACADAGDIWMINDGKWITKNGQCAWRHRSTAHTRMRSMPRHSQTYLDGLVVHWSPVLGLPWRVRAFPGS